MATFPYWLLGGDAMEAYDNQKQPMFAVPEKRWSLRDQYQKLLQSAKSGKAKDILGALLDFSTHPNAADLAPYVEEGAKDAFAKGPSTASQIVAASGLPAVGIPLTYVRKAMEDPLFFQGPSGETGQFEPPSGEPGAVAPASTGGGSPAPESAGPAAAIPMPVRRPNVPAYMAPAMPTSEEPAPTTSAPAPAAPAPAAPAPEAPPESGTQWQDPQMKELFGLLMDSVKRGNKPRSKWANLADMGLAAGATMLANSRKSLPEAAGIGLMAGVNQGNLLNRQDIADQASTEQTAARLLSVLTGQENARLQREDLKAYRDATLGNTEANRKIEEAKLARQSEKDKADIAAKNRGLDLEERKIDESLTGGGGADAADIRKVKWLMDTGMPRDQAVSLVFTSKSNRAEYIHKVASWLKENTGLPYEEGRKVAAKQFQEDSGLMGDSTSAPAAAPTLADIQKRYPGARHVYVRDKATGAVSQKFIDKDGNIIPIE